MRLSAVDADISGSKHGSRFSGSFRGCMMFTEFSAISVIEKIVLVAEAVSASHSSRSSDSGFKKLVAVPTSAISTVTPVPDCGDIYWRKWK